MTELPAHKRGDFGNDLYGAARLALALRVQKALQSAGVTWFLDAGTLLGAYRTGQVIPHDDDFDLAVYLPGFRGTADLRALQQALKLEVPYRSRIVTSYSQKVEVFDGTSERFMLPPHYEGADFHAVTVDLQVMTDAADNDRRGTQDVVYLHRLLDHVRVARDAIVPTGRILCEGHEWNAPHDPVRFLQAQYGYLGADARYDPDSRKYVKIDS